MKDNKHTSSASSRVGPCRGTAPKQLNSKATRVSARVVQPNCSRYLHFLTKFKKGGSIRRLCILFNVIFDVCKYTDYSVKVPIRKGKRVKAWKRSSLKAGLIWMVFLCCEGMISKKFQYFFYLNRISKYFFQIHRHFLCGSTWMKF